MHVESRAAHLKELPYAELLALPEHAVEQGPTALPKLEIAVWRKLREDQTLRVIVQASRHYLGGIMTRTAVAGFDKHLNGQTSDVPEGEFE
jgi:hypothetical protein